MSFGMLLSSTVIAYHVYICPLTVRVGVTIVLINVIVCYVMYVSCRVMKLCNHSTTLIKYGSVCGETKA